MLIKYTGKYVNIYFDMKITFQLCQGLGIIVNWEKSNLVPSQRVVYLGVIINSSFFRASPSLRRVETLFQL